MYRANTQCLASSARACPLGIPAVDWLVLAHAHLAEPLVLGSLLLDLRLLAPTAGSWLAPAGPALLKRFRKALARTSRWSLLVLLLSQSSVFWRLVRGTWALVSAAHFLSATARSSRARIPLEFGCSRPVPHSWLYSFDCPASPGEEDLGAAGLLCGAYSAGPVSPICY